MAPQQRRKMSVYERTLEKVARTPVGDWYLKRIAPRLDPPLLRLTGGRVSSVYPVPVLLLTTTGAKTGLPRTLPLLYLDDGDDIILIASNYGKTSHPAWYRNLVANPKVEVLAGKRSGTYSAAEITDAAERDRAWDLALDMYAGYGDYEGRAGRPDHPLGAAVADRRLSYPQLQFHPQVAVELLVFVSDSRRCALDSQACSMVHCPRSPTCLR